MVHNANIGSNDQWPMTNKHLCTAPLQGGDRHSSARRRPSSGQRPPPRLSNGPHRQEPSCLQVQLKGWPHNGTHPHPVLSHCWSYSYFLHPCFPFKRPTFFSWSVFNECFQDRSGCNISVMQCLLNYRLFLLQALLASSYLPVYAGVKPVEFRGQVMGLHTTSPLIILTAFI